MQVFKAYFKVIRNNIRPLFIYALMFIMLSIMLTTFNVNDNDKIFSGSKAKIAVFSNDNASPLVKGFINYLKQNATVVEIEDKKEKIQDALYFREIVLALRIPKNFTKSFIENKEIKIEKAAIPLSTEAIFVDNLINKYFDTARLYLSFNNNNQEQCVKQIEKTLIQNTKVTINNLGEANSLNQKIIYYYNYFSYALFAILILGVSTIMLVFNQKDLKMRNDSSPISLKSYNFQLLLGNLVFSFVVWLTFVLVGFILFPKDIYSAKTLFLIINSFIFALSCLSISFLIGNLIKSRAAQQAVANVVTLGSCFIAGVFVPQAMLGETVLKIAKFTPTYWFVKANNQIGSIVNYNVQNIEPVIFNLLIVLGFAVAVLTVTLVIIKYKRTNK